MLSGLNLIIDMLDGPPTRERMILCDLALANALQLVGRAASGAPRRCGAC